jgi:hypothetical protein
MFTAAIGQRLVIGVAIVALAWCLIGFALMGALS